MQNFLVKSDSSRRVLRDQTTFPIHSADQSAPSPCTGNVIAAGSGGDGQSALPEPDGGAAGVSLHHPRQADAALVPRAARLQHHGT